MKLWRFLVEYNNSRVRSTFFTRILSKFLMVFDIDNVCFRPKSTIALQLVTVKFIKTIALDPRTSALDWPHPIWSCWGQHLKPEIDWSLATVSSRCRMSPARHSGVMLVNTFQGLFEIALDGLKPQLTALKCHHGMRHPQTDWDRRNFVSLNT